MAMIVVLQPGYIPWLGFFDQMNRSDIFVYYDDVQFDKHGWRNRNRIKSSQGPVWLTVPVFTKNKSHQLIKDTLIDNKICWNIKHLKTIRQLYSKAPFFDEYYPEFEQFLLQDWENLVDLDIATVQLICDWLGLKRSIYRSSELGVGGNTNERLLNICKYFEADKYLSGNAAQSYLDINLFSNNGIRIEWQNYEHPVYNQLYDGFTPYLSVLDLVLNEGNNSKDILRIK